MIKIQICNKILSAKGRFSGSCRTFKATENDKVRH